MLYSTAFILFVASFASVASAAPTGGNTGPSDQSFTLADYPAPFQSGYNLPDLNGASAIDLTIDESYRSFGYADESDQFKCHGSCGML